MPADIIIGIDSGTSVVKAVAFDLGGRQIASASVPNSFKKGADGSATQDFDQTWRDCVSALLGLAEQLPGLKERTAAISVTAQGDGTWLVSRDNRPVMDAWLWLDARAAPTVDMLAAGPASRARFEATGTGLNTCQQGSQLAHLHRVSPHILDAADVALHCKDWLYLCLTGERATDPSEASFTFGNFRTRCYDDVVIDALGLSDRKHLLPTIVDGAEETHPLSPEAAAQVGLRAGTPVCLGYVDMVMTALGGGVCGGTGDAACSIVGSTGVHMRAVQNEAVHLNAEGTGYVMALPIPGMVVQAQTNMATSLNIDWILAVASDILEMAGHKLTHRELISRIDGWLSASLPGQILYHPYISEAGERGPFVNPQARAGFIGLSDGHRYADLARAVVEGLAMAMRDCYLAMGGLPKELRVSGGAARSPGVRAILSAAIGAPVRVCAREEAGDAGAAMMAAVAIGAYPTMQDCIAGWVTPHLGAPEIPDVALVETYAHLYPAFKSARIALEPVWSQQAKARQTIAIRAGEEENSK